MVKPHSENSFPLATTNDLALRSARQEQIDPESSQSDKERAAQILHDSEGKRKEIQNVKLEVSRQLNKLWDVLSRYQILERGPIDKFIQFIATEPKEGKTSGSENSLYPAEEFQKLLWESILSKGLVVQTEGGDWSSFTVKQNEKGGYRGEGAEYDIKAVIGKFIDVVNQVIITRAREIDKEDKEARSQNLEIEERKVAWHPMNKTR
ncbi:MAG TPA: hypothetical protein VLH19_03635 [Patescibacteria group bacterium]|nr:hypothetical protein [Patescibacteria group bacterium]